MFSKQFFASVIIAVTFAASAAATPFPESSKHATHRKRQLGSDFVLETYHVESTYETFGQGEDHPLRKRATDDLKDAAVSYVASKLGVDESNVAWKSGFSGEASSHAFVRQQLNGVPVANAVANVAFNNGDRVVAFGSSFVKKPTQVASADATLSLEDAIANAERLLNGSYNNHPATLEYLAKDDGSIALVHVMQIENSEAGTWFEAFVDAHSGELLSVTDFRAHATYRVLPITKEILTEGLELLTNPEDTVASPNGWHNDGTTSTTTTSGNNALAFKTVSGQQVTTSQSASGLVFDYTAIASQQPTVAVNVNAARVNAFYIVNTMHDIAYRYGFTESAFNFQTNNNGKGGRAGDRVTISVQDANGVDNADFTTPPDGQSGRMRMFLWDLTNPRRDGALENDIVVHEMTHGITNRLTGGGTGRCLQTTESGGMGEGWSDAMAEWTEQTSATIKDYVMGQYVINDPAGIRSHPYSTSATTNPLRYSSIQTLNEVHDIGEIWANLLHQVYAALVGAKGFSADAPRNPDATGGNAVYLHLFLDALALQPCNPTFVTARDAWIQADVNRFGGANKCTLWKAFASRGLGVNARNFRDDTTIPSDC